MRRHLWALGALLLLVAVVGCAGQPAPSPTPAAGVPTTIPTSLPTKGIVTGVLYDDVDRRPLSDHVLYLAVLLKPLEAGKLSVAALDPTADPRAVSDAEGKFTFTNIEPGTYALAFATPTGTALIIDPKTEKEIVFTVEAGGTVDLGTIYLHPGF